MLGTIDIAVNAKFPNMPLEPMFAFVGSASSIRVRNVPKKIGEWKITNVYFTVHYPDDSVKSAQCVLTGGIWVGTVEGCQTSGKTEKGYTVYARGIDEHGNEVTDSYVLGKGDVQILEADGTITPGQDVQYVHLLSAESATPQEGDLYPTEDGYMIWQNGEANSLGTPFEQISNYVSAYVDTQLSTKQDKLTDAQISAIDSVVDERQTVVTYVDGTLSAFDLAGEIDNTSIPNLEDVADIKIGNTVTSIGNSTFYGCTNLSNIVIPNSVTNIRASAFYGCTSLTSVTIPDSVTSIGTGAFTGCSSLTSVTIPNSVTSIGNGVFNGCSGLTSVTIGNGVTSIGVGVFEDCTSLTNVTIGSGVTSIGDDAFVGCSNLANLTFLGKTLEQVQNIEDEEGDKYYPWGITNTSIIKTWNDASQEWVTSQLPTKTSDLSNDSGYITSTQVEPAFESGYEGYAEKSIWSKFVFAYDTATLTMNDKAYLAGRLNTNTQTNELELNFYGNIDGKYPWTLSELFGTQYSPTILLYWTVASIYRNRGGRWSVIKSKQWMWVAEGQFAITTDSEGNPDGNFYVLHYGDATHPNAINDPATDVHTITIEQGTGTIIYVSTIDGQTGQIDCRSLTINYALSTRALAYRDELSAKADLSALNDYALTSQLSSYYTKSEIDNMIGDINTVLDNINGEVI